MALTVDGKVFSWGEGDDGKLGHYSRTYVTDSVSCSPAVLLGCTVCNVLTDYTCRDMLLTQACVDARTTVGTNYHTTHHVLFREFEVSAVDLTEIMTFFMFFLLYKDIY